MTQSETIFMWIAVPLVTLLALSTWSGWWSGELAEDDEVPSIWRGWWTPAWLSLLALGGWLVLLGVVDV